MIEFTNCPTIAFSMILEFGSWGSNDSLGVEEEASSPKSNHFRCVWLAMVSDDQVVVHLLLAHPVYRRDHCISLQVPVDIFLYQLYASWCCPSLGALRNWIGLSRSFHDSCESPSMRCHVTRVATTSFGESSTSCSVKRGRELLMCLKSLWWCIILLTKTFWFTVLWLWYFALTFLADLPTYYRIFMHV